LFGPLRETDSDGVVGNDGGWVAFEDPRGCTAASFEDEGGCADVEGRQPSILLQEAPACVCFGGRPRPRRGIVGAIPASDVQPCIPHTVRVCC
jgi:hypothetical protein